MHAAHLLSPGHRAGHAPGTPGERPSYRIRSSVPGLPRHGARDLSAIRHIAPCAAAYLRTVPVLLVLLLGGLTGEAAAQTPAAQAPPAYEPTWASLDTRPLPAWYDDAKFGIFIHWGTYAVPAYSPTDSVHVYAKYAEWYWRRLMSPGEEGHEAFKAFHDRIYGPDVAYQDFAPQFKAELFDPDAWARIFRDAGARYVVLTSKHHEGFALWPSRYSWNWNSVDIGPHRDLAGDLTQAVREAGLRMGFYYSLYEWFNPQYHADLDGYIDDYMWPQLRELVTRYEPDIVWPDGEWDHPSDVWKSTEFLAWLYNESPVRDHVVVNDRWGSETRSKHGGFYTTEYALVHDGTLTEEAARHKWEECRGIGGSFGYNRTEALDHYATSEALVHLLVDIVSQGGNLLLNVGPTADGRIPVIMQQRLRDMGDWLRVNGEAIYGTRPWPDAPADSTMRFTRKGDAIYAISLDWPGTRLEIPMERPPDGTTVTLIGHDAPLAWRYEEGHLVVDVPPLSVDDVPSRYAHAFKIR